MYQSDHVAVKRARICNCVLLFPWGSYPDYEVVIANHTSQTIQFEVNRDVSQLEDGQYETFRCQKWLNVKNVKDANGAPARLKMEDSGWRCECRLCCCLC
jgi:hypothetical protein